MDLLATGRWTRLVALMFMGLALGRDSEAQLISPGKLAAPHASLEGMRQCTQCHQLRAGGISAQKCLECHLPLRRRVSEGAGLHATFGDQPCSNCHRDHLGSDYRMITFDTTRFVHDSAGYPLIASHAEVGCRDCHSAPMVEAADVKTFKAEHGALRATFLGLGTSCLSCHGADDPHQSQFDQRPCDACHSETSWREAPRFDHDSTRYRLSGAHRSVDCGGCHPSRAVSGVTATKVFAGIRFQNCSDCHRDPHQGSMNQACRKCHSTSGWGRIDKSRFEGGFDHSSTGFALAGAHAVTSCNSCHGPGAAGRPSGVSLSFNGGSSRRRYPKPVATDCTSCHLDHHGSPFEGVVGGTSCLGCHGEDAWVPSTFGPVRHGPETEFDLQGRHLLVACGDCHGREDGRTSFAIEARTCKACHHLDDPHAGQFPDRDCTSCHSVEGFTQAEVDHGNTEFPLEGAHQQVACGACHRDERVAGKIVRRYVPLGTSCGDCHA